MFLKSELKQLGWIVEGVGGQVVVVVVVGGGGVFNKKCRVSVGQYCCRVTGFQNVALLK